MNMILKQASSKFKISFDKNFKGIILILLSSITTSIGQLCWKLSEANIGVYLIIGFGLYGAGAILMILAFRYGSMSVVHPLMCMSYIFALFLGYFLLGEEIGVMKIIGVILIIGGVVLIGGGDYE